MLSHLTLQNLLSQDPTALTIRLRDKDGVFRSAQFALTAKEDQKYHAKRKNVKKSFRGIAEDSASRLSRA